MFNATVAGTSNHYLRSGHISDSRGSSKNGSGYNINEVELGGQRHNKVSTFHMNIRLKIPLLTVTNCYNLTKCFFFCQIHILVYIKMYVY